MTQLGEPRPDEVRPPTGNGAHSDTERLISRTVKALAMLRWLLIHHETRDGVPLGLSPDRIAQLRGEAERLLEIFDRFREIPP